MIWTLITLYSVAWLLVGVAIGVFWQETRNQEYLWEALARVTVADLPTHELPAVANIVQFRTY